jgi:HK97 family phage major capsid protein
VTVVEQLQKMIDALQKEWADFKSDNDRRLKEIAKGGNASPETEQKMDRHSAAISEMQKSIDALTAKLNRPGVLGGGSTPVVDEAHTKAFQDYVRRGVESDALRSKAAQIGSDADGGFTVPDALDTQIGRMEIQYTAMESLVNSITMSGETYEKLFDLRGTTSGWVGEKAARAETVTPQWAQFKPSFGELYAFPFATQKMLDDAFFDVEAWLAASVGEKFGLDVDNAILNGTGVEQPRGIFSYPLAATADTTRAYGTIQKIASGSNGAFTMDNLIDVIQALKPGYRQNARWLMAQLTVGAVRKLKDGQGRYLWEPSTQVGQPSTLLQYPVTEDDYMPAIGNGANAIAFGDFKRAYKLVNVKGVRVLRDPYSQKPKVGFYTTKRLGGGVEDTSAIKVLNLA